MRGAQLEIVEVDAFPAHGDLDHAMQFAERKTRRHQNTPPHHGADPGQPDFDPEDRGGICRGQQGALFRNCGLRPSLHPTRLASAVLLVLGTPQKVMLSLISLNCHCNCLLKPTTASICTNDRPACYWYSIVSPKTNHFSMRGQRQ